MDFEWDEAKNEANMSKHGIDFDDAIGIFNQRVLEHEDRRRDYGELRTRVIGMLGWERVGNSLHNARRSTADHFCQEGQKR